MLKLFKKNMPVYSNEYCDIGLLGWILNDNTIILLHIYIAIMQEYKDC